MSKSITVQRKILKIESKDIRNYTKLQFRKENKKRKQQNLEELKFTNYEWCYDIDRKQKKHKDKVIALGESHTLRMIDRLMDRNWNIKKEYDKCKYCIRQIRKGERDKIKGKNKNKNLQYFYDKIDEMQFQENYIMIVFNRKEDFKYINKGLKINGKKFKRLYGTSGSLKNNTVIYVCDEKVKDDDEYTLFENLLRMLNNDRNQEIPLIPSKYEAYLSLNSSASTPILKRKVEPEEILVVPDHVVRFKSEATIINTCKGDKPNIEYVNDYEIELESSDGNGMISPSLAKEFAEEMGVKYLPSGFVVRNSYLKGSLFVWDIQDFISKHDCEEEIVDVWGDKVDLKRIQMVIPVSMLKLWKCYDSIKDYMQKCEKNGHTFCVTKMIGEELESERTMNYQFLQSLNLTNDEINQLIQPTIDEIKDILGNDYRKTILYTKGKYVNEANVDELDADFFKAIMIDERMLSDPHVRSNIHKMIKTFIDQCKVGKIKIHGNYSMIAGCMYEFACEVFKVSNPNPNAMLKAGEFYSGYWNKHGVKKVVAMRAPSCTHANFRTLNIVQNETLNYWYKYMQNCVVFNCHDSTAESLSGADKDKLLSLIDEV